MYTATAYLLPVVVHVALPPTGPSLDELVWLVMLVPAFLLSLHYGLRGAFVALVLGTTVLVGVQLFMAVTRTPGDPRISVPIFIAFGALAISVGWLSEQLHEHYERALEAQVARKTEALGTMAAGIAHDFNNILTAMVANAELLAEGRERDGAGSNGELEQLRSAARRGAGIVRNLLGFSRRGMLSLRALDLAGLVEGQRELVERLVPASISVRFVSDESAPPVSADPEAVERILVNLVTNARDAMPHGGSLEVAVRRARIDAGHRERRGWGDPGEYLCLSVSDTGMGMDEETLSRIFEPFFTEKEPAEAVGLGMAMVYGLLKQHRGFVDVESEPGVGTTVRVYFPLAKERVAPPRGSGRPKADAQRSETILLVEDDEPLRRAAQRILERFGYTVVAASDGEEAVQVYRGRSAEIDLVLTDVVLPKLSGPAFYRAIRTGPRHPKVLFTSGYPARTVRSGAELDPSLPFLQKPWTVEELARAVGKALDEDGFGGRDF